jgi:hypothetical protein
MENFAEVKEHIVTQAIDKNGGEYIIEKVKACENWEQLQKFIGNNIWWFIECMIKLPDFDYKSSRIEFTIINGKLHGEFKRCFENDELNIHCTFKEGELHGEYKEWWLNGQLCEKSFYKNGWLDGESKEWYSNGQLYKHCFYKDNLRDGEYKLYHENGNLNYIYTHKDDIKYGKHIKYDENQNIINFTYYVNDVDVVTPFFTECEIEHSDLFFKCIESHWNTNHKYGDKPYHYHLYEVYDAALEIIDSFEEEVTDEEFKTIILSCMGHDLMEDCRLTYNDMVRDFGVEIAEVVYALTNEKGKTREERANDKYYKGILEVPIATFVKICDRMANTKYSLEYKNDRMFEKYKKEYPKFKGYLYNENSKYFFLEKVGWDKLDELYGESDLTNVK